jgi:hypothetical protein
MTMLRRTVFTAVFVVIYFASRAPVLGAPLWGEEGMFAHMLLEPPKGGKYLLIARLSGKLEYCAPEHPAALYEIIKAAGIPFGRLVGDWKTEQEPRLARKLRLEFSAFLLLTFIVILWSALRATRDAPLLVQSGIAALVSVAAISPLAVTGSTALQTDASSGAILVGLLPAVVLAYRSRGISRSAFPWAAALGGAVTGLGKQEWTLALCAALLATAAYTIFPSKRANEASTELRGVIAIAFGLLLGNIASYLYDPINYLGGFDVMRRFTGSTGYATRMPATEFAALVAKNGTFLVAPFALIAFLAVSAPRWLSRRDEWAFLLASYGSALLAGFLGSIHVMTRNELRYFVPSLIVLLCAAVAVFPRARDPIWHRAAAAAAILATIVPSATSLWNQARTAEASQKFYAAWIDKMVRQRLGDGHCVPVLPSAYAYRASFDFVSEGIPQEHQEAFAARVGLPLCPH